MSSSESPSDEGLPHEDASSLPHDAFPPPGGASLPPGDASPPRSDASPPPPGVSPYGPKRLYRSRSDRMLGGVCGGIAAYFDVDPTIVRVAAVATLFLPGPQIIAYLVAWIIVPEEPLT
jgi:phage shock protein C